MSPLRALWQRLSEPSLVRRGTVATLLVFLLIWATLLSYEYGKNRRYLAEPPSLAQYGDALLVALDETADPAHARIFMAATERWTAIRRTQNERLSGIVLYELQDGRGERIYASEGWPWPRGTLSASTTASLCLAQCGRHQRDCGHPSC